MKRFETEVNSQLTEEEKRTLEAILNYPSLERAFDLKQPRNLTETKQRMRLAVEDCERVVRRGSPSDAAKAAKIAAAYRAAIDFLDELERLRNSAN